MILHFVPSASFRSPEGLQLEQYICREYPRVTHFTQSGDPEIPASTVFEVDGVKGSFETIGAALSALRANPLPGDIVAVPPLETSEC